MTQVIRHQFNPRCGCARCSRKRRQERLRWAAKGTRSKNVRVQDYKLRKERMLKKEG